MIIGLHNFFTSLPIKDWWLKPFSYIAKCQKSNDFITSLVNITTKGYKDICLDLRVYYNNETNTFEPAHGSMSYKWLSNSGLFYYLDTLEELQIDKILQKVYIRLILERPGGEDHFKILCNYLESKYFTLKFYGGVCKEGWKPIYTFNTDDKVELRTIQCVSSMAQDARWYEKFIPILYAKRMNKKNLEKYKDFSDKSAIILFDFVN